MVRSSAILICGHGSATREKLRAESHAPVCMVLAIPKGNQTNLILLAISGTAPRSDQTALEIPQLECRRAGIREWKDAWVTVSEFNHDIAEQSFYYDPNAEILGSFSKGFLRRSQPLSSPSLLRQARGSVEPIERGQRLVVVPCGDPK